MGIGSGIIVMWHGLIANIPAGWLLCDGTYGTPDLRESFVVGAGDGVDPGGTGGATTHTHPFTGSGHSHHISAGTAILAGDNAADVTDTANAVGTTEAGSSLPPYYDILFLMKS